MCCYIQPFQIQMGRERQHVQPKSGNRPRGFVTFPILSHPAKSIRGYK